MSALEFQAFLSDVASAIALHVAPRDVAGASLAGTGAAVVPDGLRFPQHECAFILDHEKVVWHYPDAAARMIDT